MDHIAGFHELGLGEGVCPDYRAALLDGLADADMLVREAGDLS